MSKLTKMLNLPDDADEETICSAVNKLADAGGAAEERAAQAEKEKEDSVAKAAESDAKAAEAEEKAKKADEELAAAREQIASMQKNGAAAFVAAQVAAGRIAPQDADAKKDAEDMYRRDPEQAQRMWSRISASRDGESMIGGSNTKDESNSLY